MVPAFEAGAERLARVLGEADPRERVWTWAPAQQDAAFVIRHQVQEIAVHHWDAVNAAGAMLALEPELAADAVDEFLHFSLSSDQDPADPARAPLGGSLVLRATDTGDEWRLSDGDASDLLLWLYQRAEVDTSTVDPELVKRFRALSFTD